MIISSPIVGQLGLDARNGAITRLHWGRSGTLTDGPLFEQAKREFAAYFAGDLKSFTLPVSPSGSDFQQRFFQALLSIPYGQTRTYGALAAELDVSAQAIGQACGANPIAILIPCHRILAAEGLGGYSGEGGIETKVALLKLERAAGLLI